MQFSRLRLSGFKSFVDPTEMVIEPGLTGVVGPNGCGKSNLLEALRWVMGENRAKSLRGDGMEAVIFAGTDTRPPRGMAEVALVIDNSTRDAPTPFTQESVIEITRRIERDAGSAYRINGNDVRQKDVQLLFADAATGAHSPALVSQGRIGALIAAKPQDRRAILEEAAGITGLHSRRRDAENRLRGAESNLTRLQDVIQAMETQAASLKRQARQAVKYRELAADLREAEGTLLYLRWRAAAEAVIALEGDFRDLSLAASEAEEIVARATTHQSDLAARMPGLRDTAAAAAAALQRLTLEKEGLKQEEERRLRRIEELKSLRASSEQDQERAQDALADAEASLKRVLDEDRRLTAADADDAGAREAAAEALAKASETASKAEHDYDTAAEAAASARARRSSLESDRLAVRRRLDIFAADRQQIAEELTATQATEGRGADLERARAAVTHAKQAVEQAAQALQTAEEANGRARSDVDVCQQALSAVSADVSTLEAEHQSLSLSLARSGGADDGVGRALRAKPGYELAAASAFGDALEAGTDASADRFWRLLDTVSPPPLPAGIRPLVDVAELPPALKRRAAFVGLVASDHEAEALAAEGLPPGMVLVSADGAMFRWDGYVVRAGAPGAAALRLQQQNRLVSLSEQLQSGAAARAKADAALAESQARMTAAVEAESAARAARQQQEAALVDAQRALIAAEQEQARETQALQALSSRAEALDADMTETAARLHQIDTALAELAPADGLDQALAAARSVVEAARTGLASARSRHDGLAREAELRAERLSVIKNEAEAWRRRADDAADQIKTLLARAAEAAQALASLSAAPEQQQARRDRVFAALAAAEAEEKAASDRLAGAEADMREADAALRVAAEARAQARESQIRGEAALEAASERRREIARQIGAAFGCEPTALLEAVGAPAASDLPDVSVTETRVETCKRDRDRLGAVNLRAQEELGEIQERLDHLSGERADLEAAIARLRQAISQLNKEGRERLLVAFDRVNAYFSDLFSTLFGGGTAHLQLTANDDPLDAGLEIFASPPGKKLQSLTLLSGGEQALTALALIFAVFMTNPAPICVLDEVDAPLDDANVERFCDLLDAMTAKTETRFLIVTHNAVSMARMNRLYGVTMAERGVSSLVSVDLERAAEFTDAA